MNAYWKPIKHQIKTDDTDKDIKTDNTDKDIKTDPKAQIKQLNTDETILKRDKTTD